MSNSGWSELMDERRRFSTTRINEFKDEIARHQDDINIEGLCIYVTGSYGRQEASRYSDLDLFFLHVGGESKDALSRIDKSLLDAALIKSSRALEFPEFSRGGEYLDVHYLDDILTHLGSPRDDFKNYFTARMLLILEGSPIWHPDVYKLAVSRIIDSYYRDYHDHEKDFLPIFLVNDILRFWRTLCLNYEHSRNRDKSQMKQDDIAKNHVKNLKLKFSRLLICYSMIAAILHRAGPVSPEDVLSVVEQTPAERLAGIADSGDGLRTQVNAIMEDYAWFMKVTARPEDDVLSWISDRANRDSAFQRARMFGLKVNLLMMDSASDANRLRYLIV